MSNDTEPDPNTAFGIPGVGLPDNTILDPDYESRLREIDDTVEVMTDVRKMIEDAALAIACTGSPVVVGGHHFYSPKFAAKAYFASLGLPLETLAALKAGTWKAVPVDPTGEQQAAMRDEFGSWLPRGEVAKPVKHQWEPGNRVYAAGLAAAPEKPEAGNG